MNNPIYFLDPDGNGRSPFRTEPLDPNSNINNSLLTMGKYANFIFNYFKTVFQVNQAEAVAAPVAEVMERGLPDMISLYAYAETAYSLGSYHEIGMNWITNGPESSIIPYSNYTGGFTAGWGTVGIGVGLRLGWSLENQPSMSNYYGIGSTVASGVSAGVAFSGDIGLSYSTEGVTWVTTSCGIGISVPGAGAYVAGTYTTSIGKSRFNE